MGKSRTAAVATGARRIKSVMLSAEILRERNLDTPLHIIAAKHHISVPAVQQRIKKALEITLKEPADERRALVSEKIKFAMAPLAPKVELGDVYAVDRWLACIDRYIKLWGLALTPEIHLHTPLPAGTLALLESWATPVEGSYTLLEGETPPNEPELT